MRNHPSATWIVATSLLIALGCGGSATEPSSPEGGDTREHSGKIEIPSVRPPVVLRPDTTIELPTPSNELARKLATLSLFNWLGNRETMMQSTAVVADPNQRPIRVWIVTSPGGARDIRLVGHADGECCPLISGAVQKVVDRREFSDAWFSYGYGHIVATDGSEEATLAALGAEIEGLARRRECARQVVIQSSQDQDPIATGSATLGVTARSAYAHAAALGRPLLIWHDFHDYPRIVPALAADGTTMKPLEFRIPKGVLAVPSSVTSALSMDGLGQGIAALSAEEATLKTFVQTPNLVIAAVHKGWRANFRDASMAPAIQAASARIDAAIAQWESHPALTRSRSAVLGELRALRWKNNGALGRVGALPLAATSAKVTTIEYADIEPDSAEISELRAKLGNVRTALARLKAQASLPKARPEPILTDAFLRGWPASFSSAKAETDFDEWVGKWQRPVWESVQKDLANSGLRFGTEPNGAPPELLMSNVVFQVRSDGDAMRVTPYFILAGSVAMIADPGAKVVRYESMVADQNLIHLGGSPKGGAQ